MTKTKYIAIPQGCWDELIHFLGNNLTWAQANPVMVALNNHAKTVEIDDPAPEPVTPSAPEPEGS